MSILYLNSSLYTISAVILTIAAVGAFFKRTFLVNSGRLLISFLILVLACCLILLAVEVGATGLDTRWAVMIPEASLILLIPPLVLIGRLSLQSRGSIRPILLLWFVWIALYIFVLPSLFLSDALLSEILNFKIQDRLPDVILVAGWSLMAGMGLYDLRTGIHNPDSILIQKRARLWIVVWAGILASGVLLFTNQTGWGLFSVSLGTTAAAYLLMAQDLPYPRFLVRKFLSLILFILPLTFVTWAGYGLVQRFSASVPINPIWTFLIFQVTTILVIVYLHSRFVPRLLDRWIPSASYNLSQVLHEYSQQVSQLTSPARLSRITIDLINKTLGLDFGHIYEVFLDTTSSPSQQRIEFSGGLGKVTSPSLVFSPENPIPGLFQLNRKPVRIDEIKKIITAENFSRAEITWFTNPEIDLLIPIFTKDDWVGLLVLGAKKSGEPFSIDDLTLVSTISNQLSFSFQNARMVETLMRINNDFRRTYSAMEQANHQLQQAYDQLARMDRTKSDFINVASHELRTPLTVMRGYNEMLLEDPSIIANPYQLKMVKGENSGMIRMQEVIDNMLDVATIDSRTLRLQKEALSLETVIDEVIEGYSLALNERNLTIETSGLVGIPSLQADRSGMHKVFTQLLSNAIKYTPDGGLISISGNVLAAGQSCLEDGALRISIRDSGIGIDRDQLQLIFNKFYQTGKVELHSTGKTKYKGAGPGLGLAIAKGIIEAHNGKIWAESVGQDEIGFPGTTFIFELPSSSLVKVGTLPLQK